MLVAETAKCFKEAFEDVEGLEVLCVLHLLSFECCHFYWFVRNEHCTLGYWCCPEREPDKGGIQNSFKWPVFENENEMQRNGK